MQKSFSGTKNLIINYVILFLGVAAGIALDQWTKLLAVKHLKGQEAIVWIKGVFQLEYVENRGASFGFLQNKMLFLVVASIVVSVLILILYARIPFEKRFFALRLCLGMILCGAFGNCLDRMRLHYVVDFLYFSLIDFPVFNVADIFVTTAAVFLIILLIFYYKEEEFDRIWHHGRRKLTED
ncbi:MAG: signal peptidase II [Lachnospiraceae bacterium]|nr:signal peptidase II [Lachnospiraceae bacterium]